MKNNSNSIANMAFFKRGNQIHEPHRQSVNWLLEVLERVTFGFIRIGLKLTSSVWQSPSPVCEISYKQTTLTTVHGLVLDLPDLRPRLVQILFLFPCITWEYFNWNSRQTWYFLWLNPLGDKNTELNTNNMYLANQVQMNTRLVDISRLEKDGSDDMSAD